MLFHLGFVHPLCSPPSMPSTVFCLLLSCSPFTLHLGFVLPLQDVALHQCLHCPLSVAFLFHLSPWHCPSTASINAFHCPLSVAFLFQWFLPSLLCRLTIVYLVFPLISSLSLVATWVQRLAHALSFILAICPAHFDFCFSVYQSTAAFKYQVKQAGEGGGE